jgi:hypothetical protein
MGNAGHRFAGEWGKVRATREQGRPDAGGADPATWESGGVKIHGNEYTSIAPLSYGKTIVFSAPRTRGEELQWQKAGHAEESIVSRDIS